EKGITEKANLNDTPQPKQRRRKHRPRVVIEGQPKRVRTPKTPKPDGSSTGKRKYVRKKPIEKSSETPAGEEVRVTNSTGKRKYVRKKPIEKSSETPAGEEVRVTIDLTTDEQTVKSCKRKINFDEVEKGAEGMVESTKVGESESPCPITPSKTELPQGRSEKKMKAKCHINFLEETHDKGPSCVPSPNESNCSTSAGFSKVKEAQGSKRGFSSNFGGIKHLHENSLGSESLEAFLSPYTDYNSASIQDTQLPAVYKKQRFEKGQSSETATTNREASRMQFYRYMDAYGHLQNSKKKKPNAFMMMDGSIAFAGMADGTYQQHTYMTSHTAGFQFSMSTSKKTKKTPMMPSFYRGHQIGYPDFRYQIMYDIEALTRHFERLDINRRMVERDRNAVIPYVSEYHEKNAMVLYQQHGSLVRYDGLFNPIKKTKPRPKVDLDDETTRVWRLLLEDINSQGVDGTDEDKAKWWEEERKVFRGRADSFIARMHLVQGDRRFSKWKGSVLDSVVGVFLTQNVTDVLSSSAFMSLASKFPLMSKSSSESVNEEIPVLSVNEPCQVDEDLCPMMLHDANSHEEKEVVDSTYTVDLNDTFECEVPDFSEKDTVTYNKTVIDQTEVDIVSSQNSADTSPSSVYSSVVHTAERLESRSMSKSEDEKNRSNASVLGGCASFVELLQMQRPAMVNETYSQRQAEESMVCSPGSNSSEDTRSPKERELPNAGSLDDMEVRSFEVRKEMKIIQKNREECASEESGLSAESACQATIQMVKTVSSQESAKSCNDCEVHEVLDVTNVSLKTSKASVCNHTVEASGETPHKVVKSKSKVQGGHQIVNADEGSSQVKKQKPGKKQIKVDWDNLRLEAEIKQKREKTADTMDSLDYEAVINADAHEVADAIKERGMHNNLAGRIKDMLDRLLRDHGSIDLEWLRDVPPDKAKEYLLSIRGLGLKSVECIRLLSLHHLAFPVDTNVGRIAVRLGWVPLQPLPESLQLHLLELYPYLETIQQYLWPRLCKLDQKTLYELHYQMITFGKVFCTKTKPNCNACPMRGECRHFASAFASARLTLPAPEESLTKNRTGQRAIGMSDQHQLSLPRASEQPQQLSEGLNCIPNIEEPATLGPIVEIPATPGPTIEERTSIEPVIEMPASPEPEEQIQELDIEEFCEDPEEIPMIKLNMEEFTQTLQTYMEKHMQLEEGDMSKAIVAITSEAASIPTPKLKNVSQLRTEHQVYELPDSHCLLEGLDRRELDDPSPYLFAIWTPGETPDSFQPPEGKCRSQESGVLCNDETCFFCNSTREANSETVRGTLLIPCRTATRGSFPLNGTYFQVNEVFADHASSINPIDVPRSWLWNLPRRTVYFGTSVPTIFKGLTTEAIQYCFWRGFVCVRGFDQKTRAPRPLMARLHFPASKRAKAKTDEKDKLKKQTFT
nr:protein ROS1-like [Tanacetum cinerariifolium]